MPCVSRLLWTEPFGQGLVTASARPPFQSCEHSMRPERPGAQVEVWLQDLWACQGRGPVEGVWGLHSLKSFFREHSLTFLFWVRARVLITIWRAPDTPPFFQLTSLSTSLLAVPMAWNSFPQTSPQSPRGAIDTTNPQRKREKRMLNSNPGSSRLPCYMKYLNFFTHCEKTIKVLSVLQEKNLRK